MTTQERNERCSGNTTAGQAVKDEEEASNVSIRERKKSIILTPVAV